MNNLKWNNKDPYKMLLIQKKYKMLKEKRQNSFINSQQLWDH